MMRAVFDFTSRHRRLLPLVGAIVIFATFIIKEGVRDHLKELAETVDSAQSIFLIRKDNIRTVHMLRSMQSLQRLSKPPISFIETLEQDLLNDEQDIFEHGDINYSVIRKLPDNSKLYEENRRILKATEEINMDRGGDSDRQYQERLKNAAAKSFALSDMASNLTTKVISAASERAESAKRWYDRFTWTSYVFYTIGWSLAFLGKAVGVEGLEPE